MTIPLVIPPYEPVAGRVGFAQPLSYRDSETYLSKLERLSAHLNTVIEQVNGGFLKNDEHFNSQVNSLIETVNAAITANDGALDTKISEMLTGVNQSISGVQSELAELNTTAEAWLESTIDNNDAITAAILDDDTSAATASVQRIARASLPYVDVRDFGIAAADRIAALRDFESGTLNVAVVSDSTGNDADDWVRLWSRDFGLSLPDHMRCEYYRWDDATQAWLAPTVDQLGIGTPATGGVMMQDTFNRTSAEVIGSTSSGGQTWLGEPLGVWSTNGSAAVNGGVSGAAVSVNAASRNATVAADIAIVTTGSGAIKALRVYGAADHAKLGYNFAVFATLTINTIGNVTFSIFKTINGASTLISSTESATGLTNNTAAVQTAAITLDIAGQNVTASITANGTTKTVTGTLTESDYASMGTFAGFMINGTAAAGDAIDGITISAPYVPAQYDGFTLYNGSVGGASLAYHTPKLNTMFPASRPVDVLIVSTGHNYGSLTATSFVNTVKDFLAAFKVIHPNAVVLISSQNPQFAPTSTGKVHAARNMAIRNYAMANRIDYLPVFEAFTARPDKGASLMLADGLHPNTPTNNPLDSGSRLWADVMVAAVEHRATRA